MSTHPQHLSLRVFAGSTALMVLFASLPLTAAAPSGIGRTELSHTPETVAVPATQARATTAVETKVEPAPLSHASDTAHLVPGAPIPDDPFAPYINGSAPEILREIPAPEGTPAVPETILLRHLIFKSYTADTPSGPVTNEIYAVIATPAEPTAMGRLPGVLVLHGGGGTCDVPGALRWAGRGYLAVAVDLPSIGNPEKQGNSSGAWKSFPYGVGRFKAAPDVKAGKLFDAVVAGLHGFKLLQSQPQVNRDRLGIVGISWGGYMTTMLSGLLGDQVRASFSIYGSGFYEKAVYTKQLDQLTPTERADWVKYMDAGHRAARIRARFFFAAASNDIFFFPPAVQDTYEQIPGEKNLLFIPNVNHRLKSTKDALDASTLEKDWFAVHLQDEGAAFPRVTVTRRGIDRTARTVAFFVSSERAILRSQLYWSQGGPHWKDRVWTAVDARDEEKGNYIATLPAEADLSVVAWYALVTDDRNVSVSSLIVGLDGK